MKYVTELGQEVYVKKLVAKFKMRMWSREPEKNEASARALLTGENTPHKLFIIRMLNTCNVHRWWLAEVCINCAFSGKFFSL